MIWRGVWYLLDDFTHKNLLKSSLQSLILSAVIPLIITLIWIFVPQKCSNNTILRYILILSFSVLNVAFWRGIWYLCDYVINLFTNNFKLSYWCTICGGLLILGIVQSCTSIIAPPVLYISDKDNEFYANELYRKAITIQTIYNHLGNKKSNTIHHNNKYDNIDNDEDEITSQI